MVQKLKNNPVLLLLLIGFLLSLSSCSENVLIDTNTEFENKSWNQNDAFVTKFDVLDTVNNYNFFITLRNTEDYPYQNLFVFLTTTFPNGKTKRDTINCPLANMQGKWLGKGFGGIYDNRILYMARKRFPLNGDYTIKIEQAMREEDLIGVLDVGVRIEQAP